MSLPRRTTLMRFVASVLCLLALSIYITFAPATINAASCTCGGGMDNLCGAPGQRCICLFENNTCLRCVWNSDPTCPCLNLCGGGGPGGT